MKIVTLRRVAIAGLALMASTLACGFPGSSEIKTDAAEGEPTDGAVATDIPVAQLDCDRASLAATNAQPGDRLIIEGLRDDVDIDALMLAVEPTASGGRAEGGFVLHDEAGFYIHAPAYPDIFNGGDVTLSVYSGEKTCFEQTITIEAIDAAPGAFASYISALKELMALQRETAGVTREQLLADDLSELPPQLIPLAIVQHSFDGPEYSDSLDRILDGTAESLQGEETDLEVLDAIIAQLGLEDDLRATIQTQREILTEDDSLSSHSSGKLASITQQTVIWTMNGPGALEKALRIQNNCAQKLSGELVPGMVGAVENTLMGLPGIIGNTATAVAARQHFVNNACATLLPNKLSNFTAEVSVAWFPFDWVGQPGAVSRVSLMAAGDEMNIRQAISDSLALIITTRTDDAVMGYRTQLASSLVGLAEGICELHPQCDAAGLKLGPFLYGPFDVNSSEWITVESSGVVSMAGRDPFTYKPVDIGIDQLIIRTKPEHFTPADTVSTSVKVFVAECIEAVTSVVPVEGSYTSAADALNVTCRGAIGIQTISSPARTSQGSVILNDETGCLITIDTGDAQFAMGRTAINELGAQYHGVVDMDGFSCGMAMSWDQSGQNFLGESNCFGSIGGFSCWGGTSFKMTP